jgi:hypothetical protein
VIAETGTPRDAASKTAMRAAGPVPTAAPIEDQPRTCSAVGDLSCVVPVVVTRKDLSGPCQQEADAPKAPTVSRGGQS